MQQHRWSGFIVRTDILSGDLSESIMSCTQQNFLAFFRLTGCAYFDNTQSAFGGVHTPSSLYYSMATADTCMSQYEPLLMASYNKGCCLAKNLQ